MKFPIIYMYTLFICLSLKFLSSNGFLCLFHGSQNLLAFRVTDELHVHMCEIKQYGSKT